MNKVFQQRTVGRIQWVGWLCTQALAFAVALPALAGECSRGAADPSSEKRLLWGDLHVHTAHSLDAWAFGATATPKDAYAFAKGQPLRLVNGTTKVIDRPLDFAAVTDHAETWDQMYLCTDPIYAEEPYCENLRARHKARDSRGIFNDNLLPVIVPEQAMVPGVCKNDDYDCRGARINEWRRAQHAANDANEPCDFTALIGYEWTGSPGGLHWHRNVIFGSASVPPEAYDYVRFPRVQSLWQQLDKNCLERDGCSVLTIPHNLNWADGGRTFAVETEDASEQRLRARYERLAEIFQEKGASECLPANHSELDEDCDFNLVHDNAAKTRISGPETATPEVAWQRARSSYYRSLLGRGLTAYASGSARSNPLMLGAIGSTDTHFGTPGRVAEASYDRGISTLFANDAQQLARPGFNPGGLVAVWALENTRTAVFDALHRRETYATSGPRIALRFGVGDDAYCKTTDAKLTVPMGGMLSPQQIGQSQAGRKTKAGTSFIIQATRDDALLAKVQLIKGEYRAGQLHEQVIDVAEFPRGKSDVCVSWRDTAIDSTAPAYWYARVLEQPTPRWSKLLCERADLCEKYPDADVMQAERAWSSPVWWLP